MLFFFWQVFLFYHFMTTLIYTPTQIAWEWALPFAIWVIYVLFSFIKERVYSSKQRTDAFYD